MSVLRIPREEIVETLAWEWCTAAHGHGCGSIDDTITFISNTYANQRLVELYRSMMVIPPDVEILIISSPVTRPAVYQEMSNDPICPLARP